MIPPAFDYHAPRTVGEAISLLGSLGSDAKLLAGGHSLLPMMKLRFAQPAHLIDLNRIPELRGICETLNGSPATADLGGPNCAKRTPYPTKERCATRFSLRSDGDKLF